MKHSFYIACLIILFAAGCSKDDDDDNAISGLGGDDNELLIQLNWNQADTDLDLTLVGPDFFVVGLSSIWHSGDEQSGPGEEAIHFINGAPDGEYTVQVAHFRGSGNIDYTISIAGADNGRNFDESINAELGIDRFTFTKRGGRITF